MRETITPEEAGFVPERLDALDNNMRAMVDGGQVAGIATLIACHGQVLRHRCYGKLDLSGGRPVQSDSIFRIASLTKTITAAAVLTLQEAGNYDLDDPITRWIPEFKGLKVYRPTEGMAYALETLERPPTFRHLLTHTAGFSYGFEPDDPVAEFYHQARFFSPILTLQPALPEMVRRLAQIPLVFQPGDGWRYSIAYDVLGYLVELISGMPFGAYLRERVFAPLGMADTDFYVPEEKLNRFGPLYSGPGEQGILVLDKPPISPYARPDAVPSGGGGLVSTVPDYYRFYSMLLNGGELDGNRVLAPSTVKQMLSNQVTGYVRRGQGYGFGVGVQLQDQRTNGWPRGVFGHTGGSGTQAFGSREAGVITVIMYQALNYREPMDCFRDMSFRAMRQTEADDTGRLVWR